MEEECGELEGKETQGCWYSRFKKGAFAVARGRCEARMYGMRPLK
jgi:hypothetical protein